MWLYRVKCHAEILMFGLLEMGSLLLSSELSIHFATIYTASPSCFTSESFASLGASGVASCAVVGVGSTWSVFVSSLLGSSDRYDTSTGCGRKGSLSPYHCANTLRAACNYTPERTQPHMIDKPH